MAKVNVGQERQQARKGDLEGKSTVKKAKSRTFLDFSEIFRKRSDDDRGVGVGHPVYLILRCWMLI